MSLNATVLALEDQILSVLTNMKSIGVIPYFEKAEKGRFKNVDLFPCVFFWTEPETPMGNDYITGDLIKQRYTISGFDYNPETFNDYDEAEGRSSKMAHDLRDEFSKWENRHLDGTVFQSQVVRIYVDPGAMPFPTEFGGIMAAGGIQLLVVYRQNRGQ